MRHLPLPLLVVSALLAGVCTAQPPTSPLPAPDTRQVITVEGSTVRYNGRPLVWEAQPERWQEALGPRSRNVRDISVWDELGVFLYHNRPMDSRPSSFVVLLGRTMHSPLTDSEPDFWPRQTFSGRLVVDGALIHKGSTLQQINRDKKGAAFKRDYLDGVYSYETNGVELRLDFGHDGSLRSLTVSPVLPEEPPATSGGRRGGPA
ncbi:MAG: hypothetical protein JXB05_31090 [Myxococcaceae bacterium]|nr:hypothetical protein [Myxococcaceae bacterium]